jgi:hypothetical protein
LAAATVAMPAAARAGSAPSCPLPVFGPGGSYHPAIRPSDFSADVTDPWFPLRPGLTYLYTGTKDGKKALDVVQVSSATKRIDGVLTRVVNDRLFLGDALEERTTDYYAQDKCGNVWYFGEDTATLDRNGHVTDRSGSFLAGVNGAQPGVYIQARPQIGRWFRQEWYRGQAEDRYRALSTSAPVAVRYGRFRHALRTEERTNLEPGVVDNKYYVRGLGVVKELTVRGGTESLQLADVLRLHRPPAPAGARTVVTEVIRPCECWWSRTTRRSGTCCGVAWSSSRSRWRWPRTARKRCGRHGSPASTPSCSTSSFPTPTGSPSATSCGPAAAGRPSSC